MWYDESAMAGIVSLWEAMRPRQWAKNLLLFAPLIFANRFTELPLLYTTFLAFLLFNLLSSAGYLYNDAMDVEADRKHPVKRDRPLARGALPLDVILTFSFLFALAGLLLSFLLDREFGYASAGYFAFSLLYSRLMKNIAIVEMLIVSLEYLLRVAAGAFAIEVVVSPWLLLCTFLLALVLVVGKRRAELNLMSARPVLSFYSNPLLDQFLAIAVASALVAYSFYTFQSPHTRWLMLTIPSVVYGLFRYLYLIYREDKGGAPDEELLSDKPSVVNLLLWLFLVVLAFRLGR